MLGKVFPEFFRGWTKKELLSRIKMLEKKKRVKGFEGEIGNKTLDKIPVELNFYSIDDNAGKMIGIVTVIQDISERRQKEHQLRESEEKFRVITETALDSIFLKDLSGRYLEVNPAMVRLFKSTRENLIGKTDRYLFGKKEAERIKKVERGILKGKTIIEESVKEVLGKPKSFHVIKVPLRDNTGKIVGIAGISRDITEIRKVQNEREESEKKFRLAFENSSDAILWIEKSSNKIVECNQSAVELLELPRKNILGLKYSDIFKLEKRKGLARDLKLSSKENEDELITKTGTRKVVSISTSLIKIKNKEIIQQILHDITYRKQAEESIRQSEEKYRILVDNLSEALYTVNQGKFTNLSKSVYKIFGYTEEELIGTYSWDLAVPEKREWIKNKMFEKAYSNDHSPLEIECLRKDGSKCYVEIRLSNKIDPATYVGLIRDISEEKRVIESLKESKGQFYTLVENANDGIIIFQNKKIKFANKMFLKITGYSFEELKDTDFLSLFPVNLGDITDSMFSAIREKGDSVNSFEIQLKKKSGELIDVDISSGIVQFKGKPGILSIIRDITEKKQLLLALNRAQKLEAAGNLAGQIAHDFNNLLAPIIAYPEIIKDMIKETDPIYEYIEIIQKSGKRIVDINEQLLTLGRRGYYKVEIINLNEIVRKTVSLQKNPSTVNLILNLTEELHKIKGGKSQLIRMLTNLLVNAKDAVQDVGNIEISTKNIKITEKENLSKFLEPGIYVKLTVSDNGIGIPDELKEKVFEPFFTTKEGRIQGTGLGLSIVFSVVEDHKGYIELKSEVGSGAEFNIYFPVSHESITLQDDDDDETSVPRGNERILLVDDDRIQLKVVSDLLKRLGYTVHTVLSGEEG
ncbi:MAG: PAS domain S-box protein, partial [bacterium]|nr:PAS domain S-box protein [bacterium]